MSTSDNPSLGEEGYSQGERTPDQRSSEVLASMDLDELIPNMFAHIQRAVAAVEAEREACAKVLDDRMGGDACVKACCPRCLGLRAAAKGIRARGKES